MSKTKEKRYYLKYNVASGELVLDSDRDKTSLDEFLVDKNKLTIDQAKELKERLTGRLLYKSRKPFFTEVEFEFRQLFHVCKSCGKVSFKRDIRKNWKDECKECFRDHEKQRRQYEQANRDYLRQLRKYKLHLQTLQGQIDAVPVAVVESNVRLELKIQGKTFASMAAHMQMSWQQVWELFRQKSIRKEYLLLMAEFLFTPIEKLLRLPKGMKIPYKDGVPAFWLENKFKVRYYDDSIPSRG